MIILNLVKKLRGLLKFELLPILFWALVLDVLFATAFYYAERDVQEGLTWMDSFWWAMVTMTTVGYGDFYAQTFVGRFLISYPCMLLGIGIIGYLVGTVANDLLDWASKKRKGAMTINFKDHIIICNYPSKERITDIIQELRATPGHKDCRIVLVNDTIDEIPQELAKSNIGFVKGRPADEQVLYKANITECEGVIILSEDPNDPRSDDTVFTIGSLVEMIEDEKMIPIKTVAELVRSANLNNMRRARVDGLVTSDGVTDRLLVQEFTHPGINKVIGQIITHTRGSELYLHKTDLEGKKVVDLQKEVLEHEANIQVIGIIQDQKYVLNPPKQMVIHKGDQLIVLAENKHDLNSVERDIMAK
ncbi:MAG: ion channel [Acidobacteriota bacterium]|nr:ion channel [Acidobacteriota bacterium]